MQKESATERAHRRRQALLSLLHQRPYCYKEIIEALDRKDLFIYDRMDDPEHIAQLQRYQFNHDMRALRLHYEIECDPKSRYYSLLETPFGVALSTQQLAAFAVLLHTFTGKTIPYAQDIQDLLVFLMSRLPEDQQNAAVEQHRVLNIDLSERTDYSSIDAATLNVVGMAILRKQQLAFTHRSARAGKELRHVIEPMPLDFKNGHVYLHGWSVDYDKKLTFRLDYILPGTAKMLPKRCKNAYPSARSYTLRYYLTPLIARNSVSQHFPNQHVEPHSDGSATVTAQVTDVFEARQIVLKYGENCIVESPPTLVEQMQIVATHYVQTYLTPQG